MGENDYNKIEKKLKISLNKLYRDSEEILQEIEQGLGNERIENPKVGFQGVRGSFGEKAAIDYFKENSSTLYDYEEFEDVLIALDKGEIDYGVLPIENSSTGEVLEVYDLINKYHLYIVGEHTLEIKHYLLGVKGSSLETIKEVYSHPQALGQCKKFLKDHRHIVAIPHPNTAMASKMVAEERNIHKAAIGSIRAANIYDLEIIQRDIQTNDSNFTRFIILSKTMEINPKCDKVSIVFTTEHKSGALYNILAHFAYNGLNLLKIQSRPIKNQTWHYFFFLDIEGNLEDANVLVALGRVKGESQSFRILGNFKQDRLSVVKDNKEV